MLTVQDLVVEVGGKRIVDRASLQVRPGDKVGLVGRNGAGKTTLLRVLGGAASPRAGIVRRGGATGYLSQDPRGDAVPDDTTVLAHVLSGRGLDELQARLEKLRVAMDENPSSRNIERFGAAQEQFEAAGGYAAEAEVRKLAAGVGLREDRLDVTLGALSGGERRRVELVRILFGGSDLLLLDEPTNHLDADARTWLLKFLRGVPRRAARRQPRPRPARRGDHARRPHRPRVGGGHRHAGRVQGHVLPVPRSARPRRGASDRGRSQAEQGDRPPQRAADAMRGQSAKRARVARNFDGRVARLEAERVAGPARKRANAVRFPAPPTAGRTVLTATELWKSFGPLDVFADVSFDVGRGERLLVMGLNGAGKTTLLKVLAGQLAPDLGTVELGLHVAVGYYAQEHEGIDEGRTLLDHMRDASTVGDGALRNLLGMFGLSGDKVFQDAATLSGGEKTKLALAQLVAGRHNVLLLDEPTNNLDPASRAATGEALAAWPGTMVVVSHDEEFVRSLAPDRALLMPDATLDYFDDDMLDLVELA